MPPAWLPLALLAVAALIVSAAPWKRIDPKHNLIFSLLGKALGDCVDEGRSLPAATEDQQLGHCVTAGHHHRYRSTDF